jgi:hypothetical protein
MKRWSRYLVGVVAVTGLLVLVAHAGAETCKLKMKRVDTSVRSTSSGRPVEYRFRSTSSQTIYQQLGGSGRIVFGSDQEDKPEFSEVVKKEPADYVAETPFRGVAKLGSHHYGFVLDIAPPEEDEDEEAEGDGDKKKAKEGENEEGSGLLSMLSKTLVSPLTPKKDTPGTAPVFSRLYFDLNRNGDLTDDEVIEATSARPSGTTRSSSSFPTVELTLDADGKEVDYAFNFRVSAYVSGSLSYAYASLSAAAYREGEIMLDGDKRRVVLVDFNSNGRFDDAAGINDKVRLSDGTAYPTTGDMLFVDPQPSVQYNPYDSTSNKDQYQVSKLINYGGRFFDVKIHPSGEELTLEPSKVPVGHVKNPNKGYRAVVYGDQGMVEISDDESGKALLPAGEWKLLSYTIQQTEVPKPKTEDEEEDEEKSILETLSSALAQAAPVVSTSRPRLTMVSARAKRDYDAVKVVDGKTSEMRFGPPYTPTVTTSTIRPGRTTLSLNMRLVGTGGEVCSNLLVNSRRPGAPEFTISTPDGEEVDIGKFKYG